VLASGFATPLCSILLSLVDPLKRAVEGVRFEFLASPTTRGNPQEPGPARAICASPAYSLSGTRPGGWR